MLEHLSLSAPNAPQLLVACCLLAACSNPRDPQAGQAPDSTAQVASKPALSGEKVYELMCSMCHGENGDGHGIVATKTQARSFIDGGYSFGNTPEAVFKTVRNGIGGTEMPAFKESLSAEERHAVSAHVLAFNPENSKVRAGDPIMRVTTKPLIVRGHLPSVVDGAPERPRGLLVGTIDGLTWEYRADDLRLLAVRKGEFVERKDWGGRGGAPLKPLGEIIWLNQEGDPSPPWKWIKGDDKIVLVTKLIGTTIENGRALVKARLEHPNGDLAGNVEMWGSSTLQDGMIQLHRNFRLVAFAGPDYLEHEGVNLEYVPGFPMEFSK